MNSLESAKQIGNSVDLSITSLIMSSDFVGKSVIIILLLASIWSWAIIISKLIYYSSVKRKISKFESLFWSGLLIEDLYQKASKSVNNPLSVIFVNTISEFKKYEKNQYNKSLVTNNSQKERLSNIMHLSKNLEIEKLDSRLGFLATIGSSAPFIGLFGTVWGIMHSFQSIAASKNTTLSVVAPGIAEALLATAIGLFAAIPAVIFYNYLSSVVDNIDNRVNNFITELSTLISRAIDENKI